MTYLAAAALIGAAIGMAIAIAWRGSSPEWQLTSGGTGMEQALAGT
jgi:hypothetical protein